MPTTYPLVIWTLRSYIENGYTAASWCSHCRCWRDPPDLPALVAAGHGEQPLRDLKLTCPRCRAVLDHTIYPPREPGGDDRFESGSRG